MLGTARRARRNGRAIAALLVGAAIAFGSGAPAGADPSPFSTLSSGCQDKGPADRDALMRGIRHGIADWPAPTTHTSARTTCDVHPTAG